MVNASETAHTGESHAKVAAACLHALAAAFSTAGSQLERHLDRLMPLLLLRAVDGKEPIRRAASQALTILPGIYTLSAVGCLLMHSQLVTYPEKSFGTAPAWKCFITLSQDEASLHKCCLSYVKAWAGLEQLCKACLCMMAYKADTVCSFHRPIKRHCV